MHWEVGRSRSVCDVGKLGWRRRKGVVPGCEGVFGDLHPPPIPQSPHTPSLLGPRKHSLTAPLM